jgi:hypothetical protein
MVLKESRPYLDNIRQRAPQLNKSLDRFMDEVKELEAELASLVGAEAESRLIHETARKEESVGDDDEPLVPYCFGTTLSYERLPNNKWGFTIRRYRLTDENEFGNWDTWTLLETTPLFQATREERIAARPHIPALVKKISDTLDKMTATLDEPIEQ